MRRMSGRWRRRGLRGFPEPVRGTWLLLLLLVGIAAPGYYVLRDRAPPAETPEAGGPQLQKFHFYKMLKQVEVEVPEEGRRQTHRTPMLQAGFFRQQRNAETRREHLVSLGMEARVLPHESGWRVLLGPFPSRLALQRTRERLQLQDIEVQRIAVPGALLREELNTSPETDRP